MSFRYVLLSFYLVLFPRLCTSKAGRHDTASSPVKEDLEPSQGCESDVNDRSLFKCNESAEVSECISAQKKCNGVSECSNGWDESVPICGCESDEFQCNITTCISALRRCDGLRDCADGIDEVECETYSCLAPTHCKCNNYRCIPCDLFCDFKDDCGDATDENNCHPRECFATEYKCANSECINPVFLCDGQNNCQDGSDEIACERQMRCANGLYVERGVVCDGWVDCGDTHTDEINCGNCSTKQYRCNNGRCINAANVCDAVCDCLHTCDDETNCETLECPAVDSYRCVSKAGRAGRCIPRSALCDGRNDCWDSKKGIDESCYNATQCHAINDFLCRDGRCIPIGRRCNHVNDCSEGDDETNCYFPACSEDDYRCDNGQCVTNQNVCNGKPDCFDGSDERNCHEFPCPNSSRKCDSGHCVPRSAWCDFVRDCPDYSDEKDCGDVYRTCGDDEFRCTSGQCIAKSQICFHDKNSNAGCKDRSHLIACSNWTCSESQSRCLYSYCIPSAHVCDGAPDCVMSYWDESDVLCSMPCPLPSMECLCRDETVNCSNKNLRVVPRFEKDRYLNKVVMVGNYFNNSLNNDSFIRMERATSMDLSRNHINKLPSYVFTRLFRLDSLILQDNELTRVESMTFSGLSHLTTLYLQGNSIADVAPKAFFGLTNLRDLDLSKQNISTIHRDSFKGLRGLLKLNLSGNRISNIEDGTFNSLGALLQLDISNNNIETIEPNAFNGLTRLRELFTDEFRFCCLAKHVSTCRPLPDEFSSCEDLMSNAVLRVCIWVIGLVAAFCNIHVIGWRAREIHKSKVGKVHSFLITNLAVADFLMGVYLLIIASVDSYYRGTYIAHDRTWRASSLCQFSGFLSTVSSEVSVFTLTTITVDRLISIIFPFQIRRLTFRDARIAMVVTWLFVLILASIPLIKIPYFHTFYGRSPVCLPLHITAERPLGWEYSVFVFLALNSVSFLIIATSYITMYSTAKRTRQAVRSQESRTDNAMARRMTLIVLTDFLCWVPIIILGVTSLAGARIPQQVYAWVAVFVLPLNSAVNPLLYTLSTAPFLTQIQHRASYLRKSWAVSANGETRESYAGESVTCDLQTGRDCLRNKETIHLRGMRRHVPCQNRTQKNGQQGVERSPELIALRDTTETDSDW